MFGSVNYPISEVETDLPCVDLQCFISWRTKFYKPEVGGVDRWGHGVGSSFSAFKAVTKSGLGLYSEGNTPTFCVHMIMSNFHCLSF